MVDETVLPQCSIAIKNFSSRRAIFTINHSSLTLVLSNLLAFLKLILFMSLAVKFKNQFIQICLGEKKIKSRWKYSVLHYFRDSSFSDRSPENSGFRLLDDAA